MKISSASSCTTNWRSPQWFKPWVPPNGTKTWNLGHTSHLNSSFSSLKPVQLPILQSQKSQFITSLGLTKKEWFNNLIFHVITCRLMTKAVRNCSAGPYKHLMGINGVNLLTDSESRKEGSGKAGKTKKTRRK